MVSNSSRQGATKGTTKGTDEPDDHTYLGDTWYTDQYIHHEELHQISWERECVRITSYPTMHDCQPPLAVSDPSIWINLHHNPRRVRYRPVLDTGRDQP